MLLWLEIFDMFILAENVDKTTVCELELDEPKVMQFKQAIENNYWFELFMGMHCVLSYHVNVRFFIKHLLYKLKLLKFGTC